MKTIKSLLVCAALLVNVSTYGQEATEQTTQDNLATGYISDDLFIYMHAGPGNNYRILGSINAGDEVKLTSKEQNGYSQIIDNKNRTTWVESKYVSTKPGLRVIIAELNAKLADNEEVQQQTSNELLLANQEINQLNDKNTELSQQLSNLNQQLTQTQSQLSNQDLAIKKEYFFNGAIVLGLGLLLGLILPRLAMRKRSSMDSWK